MPCAAGAARLKPTMLLLRDQSPGALWLAKAGNEAKDWNPNSDTNLARGNSAGSHASRSGAMS